MLINFDKNFVFLHIEKTAGTSMCQALQKVPGTKYLKTNLYRRSSKIEFDDFQGMNVYTYPNVHLAADSIQQVIPNLKDFFVFAFVRNPITRYVSLYLQAVKTYLHLDSVSANDYVDNSKIGLKTDWTEKYPFQRFTFDFFLRHWMKDGLTLEKGLFVDGESITDFVGKFENLETDWQILCNKIDIPYEPLPHLNQSGLTMDIAQKYYTPDLLEFLFDNYSMEFKEFGYEKG